MPRCWISRDRIGSRPRNVTPSVAAVPNTTVRENEAIVTVTARSGTLSGERASRYDNTPSTRQVAAACSASSAVTPDTLSDRDPYHKTPNVHPSSPRVAGFRQDELDPEPAAGPGPGGDGAAVGTGDRADDGQAEAGALGAADPVVAEPAER